MRKLKRILKRPGPQNRDSYIPPFPHFIINRLDPFFRNVFERKVLSQSKAIGPLHRVPPLPSFAVGILVSRSEVE